MALVEDCLRENDYEVELAVVEVLQLMSLAEDTCTSEYTTHFLLLPHLVAMIESVYPPLHQLQLPTTANLTSCPALLTCTYKHLHCSHLPAHLTYSWIAPLGHPVLLRSLALITSQAQAKPQAHILPHKHIASSEKPPSAASQANTRGYQKPGKAHNVHHQQVKLII